MTNLGLLPPFIDESSALYAAQNYSLMERLFFGKYLGYLLQRPVVELANNPLWAGRALSVVLGLLGAGLATDTMRRLAGARAAFTCVVLLALGPQLVFHDRLALLQSFAVFFAAAAGWLGSFGRQRQQSGYCPLAGVAAVCACATKIYTATILLFIPALAGGVPGGLATFVRRELPWLAGNLTAGSLLLLLSAVDPTWGKSFALEEVVRAPRSIVRGSSAEIPPLSTRLVNAASPLAAYLPATAWLLLVSALASRSALRSRTIGCLLVAGLGVVLYADVFRSFVATRYFNVLWLPAD